MARLAGQALLVRHVAQMQQLELVCGRDVLDAALRGLERIRHTPQALVLRLRRHLPLRQPRRQRLHGGAQEVEVAIHRRKLQQRVKHIEPHRRLGRQRIEHVCQHAVPDDAALRAGGRAADHLHEVHEQRTPVGLGAVGVAVQERDEHVKHTFHLAVSPIEPSRHGVHQLVHHGTRLLGAGIGVLSRLGLDSLALQRLDEARALCLGQRAREQRRALLDVVTERALCQHRHNIGPHGAQAKVGSRWPPRCDDAAPSCGVFRRGHVSYTCRRRHRAAALARA